MPPHLAAPAQSPTRNLSTRGPKPLVPFPPCKSLPVPCRQARKASPQTLRPPWRDLVSHWVGRRVRREAPSSDACESRDARGGREGPAATLPPCSAPRGLAPRTALRQSYTPSRVPAGGTASSRWARRQVRRRQSLGVTMSHPPRPAGTTSRGPGMTRGGSVGPRAV